MLNNSASLIERRYFAGREKTIRITLSRTATGRVELLQSEKWRGGETWIYRDAHSYAAQTLTPYARFRSLCEKLRRDPAGWKDCGTKDPTEGGGKNAR